MFSHMLNCLARCSIHGAHKYLLFVLYIGIYIILSSTASRSFDSFPHFVDRVSIPRQEMSTFPPPVLLYGGVELKSRHSRLTSLRMESFTSWNSEKMITRTPGLRKVDFQTSRTLSLNTPRLMASFSLLARDSGRLLFQGQLVSVSVKGLDLLLAYISLNSLLNSLRSCL